MSSTETQPTQQTRIDSIQAVFEAISLFTVVSIQFGIIARAFTGLSLLSNIESMQLIMGAIILLAVVSASKTYRAGWPEYFNSRINLRRIVTTGMLLVAAFQASLLYIPYEGELRPAIGSLLAMLLIIPVLMVNAMEEYTEILDVTVNASVDVTVTND